MVVKGLWTWRNWILLLLIIGGALIVEEAEGAPSCKNGQKLRTNSDGQKRCCYTVVCNTSQDFRFCSADQGYDFCIDCPLGTYTNDIIDTASFNQDNLDICVNKPKCNADEVILVDNGCQCNRGKGHYGKDPKNCGLDSKNCKDAGKELDFDGNCIECPDNKFKPESGQYGVCRDKRRCKEDEVEIDSGTKDRDRQCQKIRLQTTSVPTPTAEPTKQENTTHSDMPEKEESLKSWVVVVILFVVGSVVGCIFWKRKYITTCFGNIHRGICSIIKPSAEPYITEEVHELLGGVRDGIPVENDKRVQEKTNSDEHETNVKDPTPPGPVAINIISTEEQVPPLERPVVTDIISTEEPETSVKGIMDAPCTSLDSSNNNSSSLGQNPESIICMFETPTRLVRQPHISLQPVYSIHDERDSDTTPKSTILDSGEFTTAHTEPCGNLPHSDLIQNLPTVTQPEEQAVTPDGATGNASAQTNTLIKEDDNRGNRTKPAKKPVATVMPMIQMPQNPSNVAADMHDPGQGFTASPTTDQGNDLQSPTPELQGSYKVIPNAPYGEYTCMPTGNLSAIGEDINESQEGINDGNIGIESQANNNVSTIEGDAIQSNPTDTSAEDNQDSIGDYVGVAGNLGGGDEIVDTESQAVGQGPNMHTTSSGNPLAAPSQDEASSNEPLLQGNVDNEESEDEQGGERQRIFEC